jgi:spore maturation protein CgeB
MKLAIFGLTISSAWGNGHATLWRGLCRALGDLGHHVVFFERDVPYYACHRDDGRPDGCELRLYADWTDIAEVAERTVRGADVAMVTSYCPDGRAASELVLYSHAGRKVFYDLDTPITLSRLSQGESVDYLPPDGLQGFDLVLSYTGGRALHDLRCTLGARAVAPLYGSVDPKTHYPVEPDPDRRSDLSYLGTYAADRQPALDALFLEPARRRPQLRFAIAGSQYPQGFPWGQNVFYFSHVPPPDHPSFYCSSGMTLNVTRGPMAAMGYCPSGRLFEAAACGTPVLSDWWAGLDEFFEPASEILIATTAEEVIDALDLSPDDRGRIARAARERTLECHTARVRARELLELLETSAISAAGRADPPRSAIRLCSRDRGGNTGDSSSSLHSWNVAG